MPDKALLDRLRAAAGDFSNARYPQRRSLDEMEHENRRVIEQARPFTVHLAPSGGMAIVRPDEVPSHLVVDLAGHTDEAIAKRQIDAHHRNGMTGADVFSTWFVCRDTVRFVALLYLDIVCDLRGETTLSSFYIAFDLRDKLHRQAVTQIEMSHSLQIDYIDRPIAPRPVMAQALSGHGETIVGVAGVGMTLQVTSSILSALRRDPIFRQAVQQDSLDKA